jgi:methylmalonyl-CoA/ethylmalonyl-CoA epimerase
MSDEQSGNGPASHDTPIRVDHTGIAVESIADAEPVLFALGCQKRIEESVEGRFRWAQYDFGRGASRLELLAPESGESFLTEYLDRHGPGLHHVTLEVADIDAVVEALEAAELDVVEYQSFEDWTEAFVSPTNPTGTLFQLMEYHDSYDEGRPSQDALYVDGTRLTDE